ncbi:MAG TPA: AmmeMemoRadiSam system protein B [Candidatus Acidoferrales bacterium]|nr:AmmeMemoRadiSam system protein B [Candidatus Acidoferrales bacterium]
MIRSPAVAGRFYPSDTSALAQEIDRYVTATIGKSKARACLVPHAGYIYSGHVAGAVYGSIEIPPRCILIGPRHFPRGAPMSILIEGSWATPFGEARIHSTLAKCIARECPLLREDPIAHQTEHSLEVQVPFLQRLAPDFLFVPIVLASDRFGALEDLGHGLARVLAAQTEPCLLVISSDMNHYESDDLTRVKDRKAIDRILAVDPQGFYETVRNEEISMCGYGATVTALVAIKDLGSTEGKLVRYATSGDVSGDRNEVVGYAGIVFP